mgnify:CR=1 FL=1
MHKVILVSHNQFGYQISHLKYAEELRSHFTIEYVCLDYGKPRLKTDLVEVSYIRQFGNKFLKLLYFSFQVSRVLKHSQAKVCLIKYYPFCSIVPLFSRNKCIVDVRTGSVNKNNLLNLISDLFLKFEISIFDTQTILSDSLKKRLKLKNARVLPLVTDFKELNIQFDHSLNLIYVGSLHNRNIVKTIDGLAIFLNENPSCRLEYKIIGKGKLSDEKEIAESIKKHCLGDKVKVFGYIKNSELKPYLEKSNVGISFIPITKYYNYQPATKTYEYLASGIPVIATRTFENQKVINDTNGAVIDDNPESFSQGLMKIWTNMSKYNSHSISQSVKQYSYNNMVHSMLIPEIENLLKK